MRYYGCKTKLLKYIEDVVESIGLKEGSVFFDIFSGTSVVGKHFKKLGYTIYSNDFLEMAYAIAYSGVQLNKEPSFKLLRDKIKIASAQNVIDFLNNLKPTSSFITINYSPFNNSPRKYLSTENAQMVDSIRIQIENWKKERLINKGEYYYLLTSLLDAVNLVSNITGTYAAFLKTWDKRALKKIYLNRPEIIPSKNKNKAFSCDANDIIKKIDCDILYIDPPYNSRQFAANYFLLELITEGWFNKEQKIYGQSGMRPYNHQKSKYSIKKEACEALGSLINEAKAKYILMSYNNEGIIPLEKVKSILSKKGSVKIFSKDHKRYRAINQDGSIIRTKELLFLVKVK